MKRAKALIVTLRSDQSRCEELRRMLETSPNLSARLRIESFEPKYYLINLNRFENGHLATGDLVTPLIWMMGVYQRR